ncbi:hypothetical protein [Clostridium cylindrosporum]|uniref:Uncharacterized protein n=1 Tax=Clostridium cylindrosporum DSM 605 TaxID=1121307 RepID=A0A0J8G3D4_CLOCY|nr:hypothetical protein [Clostridium cylindrosporum]KMT22216.1 hypothetical protein CLCY_4c01890 [Clostridium cylindrosporum DSM 605]
MKGFISRRFILVMVVFLGLSTLISNIIMPVQAKKKENNKHKTKESFNGKNKIDDKEKGFELKENKLYSYKSEEIEGNEEYNKLNHKKAIKEKQIRHKENKKKQKNKDKVNKFNYKNKELESNRELTVTSSNNKGTNISDVNKPLKNTTSSTTLSENKGRELEAVVTKDKGTNTTNRSVSKLEVIDPWVDVALRARRSTPGERIYFNMGSEKRMPRYVLNSMFQETASLEFDYGWYTWTIHGENVDNIINTSETTNLGAKTFNEVGLSSAANGQDIMQIRFDNKDNFPVKMDFNVKVGEEFSGETVYIYYRNAGTDILDFKESEKVDEDGYTKFNINRGGDYVVTDKKLKPNEEIQKNNKISKDSLDKVADNKSKFNGLAGVTYIAAFTVIGSAAILKRKKK